MRKHESLFHAFWVVRIREFRIKMELTQERLAEKLCLSTRNYQKLERGVHKPSAIMIILFLYLLSDQEIISFIRSFGQMVEKGGCLTMQTKTPYIPTRERTTAVPLGNFDVMEDGNTLVNRLYYAVPRFENGRFQCSVFYEENIFRKESNGDLMLVHSEYGIDDQLESE